MKGVILTAGRGNRMYPLTSARPKAMLPAANKPIVEHLLNEMTSAGIRDFLIVVGYCGNVVCDYFGTGERWGVKIGYVDQSPQLGTAHALRITEELVNEKFLLVNGDVLVRAEDISKLLDSNGICIAVARARGSSDLGIIEAEENKVVRIYEKARSLRPKLVNAGMYLLTKDVFSVLRITGASPRGEYEFTHALQLLIDYGCPVSYKEVVPWFHLTFPWDLLDVNNFLLRGMATQNTGDIEEHVILKGVVAIGERTLVRSGSYIVGPVVIGRNCEVGPNSYIRPYTSIGDNCRIGAAVEIKNSVIMKNSTIPHHNYIGDSVIGESCNLGAGAKVANVRLDKGNLNIGKLDTTRKKLGAMMGDNVEVGINACVNAGSVIGSGSYIGPGALVSGIVPPSSRIFR